MAAGTGSGLTRYAADKFAAHLVGQAQAELPTPFLALFTDLPDWDSAGTECSGPGYARMDISGKFSAPSNGIVVNNAEVLFPQATGDWGEIVAYAVMDAATDGNMWNRGYFVKERFDFTGDPNNNTITAPGHTLTNGQKIVVEPDNRMNMPSGLSLNTIYYVSNVSGDSLQLLANEGDATPVSFTTSGAGTIGRITPKPYEEGDQAIFHADSLKFFFN